MKNGVFKEPFELKIPHQKNRIVPPEKMALLDQKIRKAKIGKNVRDRMDNTSSPDLLTLCHDTMIPGTNTYYMCKYFSYKQQSTIFHIAFSHEFSTNSLAIEQNKFSSALFNLAFYQKKFFDKEYMLQNKKKIFKHSEYFLVFSSEFQTDYDASLKDLIKYLGISKKKLKENRNLVSLWDSFPSLSRVINYKKMNMRRYMRNLIAELEAA